jgi:hypothetical protein
MEIGSHGNWHHAAMGIGMELAMEIGLNPASA